MSDVNELKAMTEDQECPEGWIATPYGECIPDPDLAKNKGDGSA